MSEQADDQYRKQIERAETSRATVKAWLDVWVARPLAGPINAVSRPFAGRSRNWWSAVIALAMLVPFVTTLGGPVLVHLYKTVWGQLPVPGDEAFGRLGTQVAAVIGGAVGLAFLFWRTFLTQRQTHIANETLYTQLLTKAVEQLGATREEKETRESVDKYNNKKFETITKTVPNTGVRLGAIYALEKIAQDYLPLHWQVMEILCAYIRKTAGPPRPMPDDIRGIQRKRWSTRTDAETQALAAYRSSRGKPALDVQCALTVIGRRSPERRAWEEERRKAQGDAYRLVLRDCHLAAVDLRDLNFAAARFERACLDGADVGHAHLEGAHLRHAHLERAELYSAHLERADLMFAHLEGADLMWAHLEGADLDSAHLEGADLMFTHLEGANLERAHLEDAHLSSAHLEGANLVGIELQGMRNLSPEQLSAAWGTPETILPEGFAYPNNERWLTPKAEAESEAQYHARRSAHFRAWLDYRRDRSP